MKTWRCRVCAYEYQGEEPPEKCPQCGADRSFFDLDEPQGASASAPPAAAAAGGPAAPATGKLGRLAAFAAKWLIRLHAHPVSAHVPNGVLPVAVVFLGLGLVFGRPSLREAAFYNLVFVMVAMPLVLISGYLDWKTKLKKARTPLILGKMACGAVVLVVGVGVIVWRIFDGEACAKWSFFFAHLVMLAAAGTAGYLGGKLVFGRHEGLD
jgi:uncharacterized membrane protein